MLRTAVLALIVLLALGAPVCAQNPTCPTAPTADSSNRCASTAFVKNAFAAAGRQRLLAATTLYAAPSGGVTGNCLSALSPCTIQYAWDYAMDNLDFNGFNITISLANGTYAPAAGTQALVTNKSPVGCGGSACVTIAGTSNTATIVSTTSADAFYFGAANGYGSFGGVLLSNFKVQTTTTGNALTCQATGATITLSNVNFGASAGTHIYAGHECFVSGNSYLVSGSTPAGYHIYAYTAALVAIEASTIVFSNSPAFTVFIVASQNSTVLAGGATFTNGGTVTGQRYVVEKGGFIDDGGSGETYLPGSSAGAKGSGGIYGGNPLAAAAGGTGITSLGTGVATALGVNVGTAGAFVVNGGALGSPSSAGTLPAVTLGGIATSTDATDSTSGATGAIHTAGGLGVIKTAFIGADLCVGACMTAGATHTLSLSSGANTTGTFAQMLFGQPAGNALQLLWNAHTTPALASATIGTVSNVNPLSIDASTVTIQGSSGGALSIGTTATVTTNNGTTDSTSTSTGSLINKGGLASNKRVWMNGLTTASTSQTAYVCQASSGELIADTSAVNLCVASSERFKTPLIAMSDYEALAKTLQLQTVVGRYKPEGIFTSEAWQREHIWFSAERVEAIDKRLVSYGPDGKVYSIDYTGVFAMYAGAFRALAARITELEAR